MPKEPSKRTSDKSLGEIELSLDQREHQIIRIIHNAKFILTSQVMRILDLSSKTYTARLLNKLKDLGLISKLPGKDHTAGRSEYIWYLTEPGERILTLGSEDEKRTRKVIDRNSTLYLRHIIATAESYVQLVEICRKYERKGMMLSRADFEPNCWRNYHYKDKTCTLKPDLYAATILDGYEDSWFIEMDLGTEDLPTILDKTDRYHQYYRSGIEQLNHEVFPVVVWLVPDEKRKKLLDDGIRKRYQKEQHKLFIVITPDEFEALLTQTIDNPRDRLC